MTSKPLKIAIAASGLSHVQRGIESWAGDLAEALVQRTHHVLLCKGSGPVAHDYEHVLPCWRRDARRTKCLMQVLPKQYFWRWGLGSHYGIEQTTFALRLIPLLRRHDINVLHVQDPLVALAVQRARRRGILSTRVILGHGTEETWSTLNELDYVQQLAPWHLEQAVGAGVAKPLWTAIPNFVDTDRFHPGMASHLRAELQIPQNALVVLIAAAIKATHKRIDYLLREMGELIRSRDDLPIWLIVAGNKNDETAPLIQLGQHLLGDRVRFLVNRPREQMPDVYRTADVFVLTSLFEMMPIALLEALATGLPCIVHQHDVLEWMIGPGGLAVDMSHRGVLADAVARLLDVEAERASLSDQARRHCLNHFSRPAVVDRLLAYYQRVSDDPAVDESANAVRRQAS